MRGGRESATAATGSILQFCQKEENINKKVGAHFHSYHNLHVSNRSSPPISLPKALGV